jgi:hypothetical protein
MSAAETARAIAGPINDVGGRFMLSGRTYAAGNELGFAGLDFYFCGRAGVLGAVDADTVVRELGFFDPVRVREQWTSGLTVMEPGDASRRFIEVGYGWGRARLPQDLPSARLAELGRRVVDAMDASELALFDAWRREPWPDDDRDAAMHAIHLLRELRGGAHVRAVRAAGVDPHAAVMVHSGDGIAEAIFGWTEPHPDPADAREAWNAAEEDTNDAVAAAVESLDESEQAELVDLARRAVPG